MKYLLTIGGLSFGGAERVLSNIANWLAENGNDVVLLAVHKKEPAYELDERINFINGLNWSGKLSFFSVCKEYRNIVKKEKPDVILSFLTQINLFVIFASMGMKIPVVVSERNAPQFSATTKLRKILRAILYPIADGAVFQTEDAKAYFDNIKLKETVVIPNPIYIDSEIDREAVFAKKKMIISAGRLFGAKNHEMTIRAFSKIATKFPEYNLTIYGEGELRDSLEIMINELGLSERVFLPGNTRKLHKCMKEAEIFVLSSHFEGMPNVLMEAMACGMCAISTDCPAGGPKFLIEDGKNGFLIPLNDENALCEKLICLIENPEVREQVEKEAAKIYDTLKPEMIYSKWQEFLKKVAKEK